MQGRWIPLKKEEGGDAWSTTLPKKMKSGFYFFKVEAGEGSRFARDSYLFQIYRPGMRAYMQPLTTTTLTEGTP